MRREIIARRNDMVILIAAEVGFAVFCAYAAVSLVVGAVVLSRRDV